MSQSFRAVVPNPFATRDWFCGRQFFNGPRSGGWFQDNSSALHSLCTFPHYYYISSPQIIRHWILEAGDPWFSPICGFSKYVPCSPLLILPNAISSPWKLFPNPPHPQEFQATPDTQHTAFSRRPAALRKDAELLWNQHGYTCLWCLVSCNSISSSRTDTMSSSLRCSICLEQGLVGNQHHRKLEEGALQTLEKICKWPFTPNDWMSLQNVWVEFKLVIWIPKQNHIRAETARLTKCKKSKCFLLWVVVALGTKRISNSFLWSPPCPGHELHYEFQKLSCLHLHHWTDQEFPLPPKEWVELLKDCYNSYFRYDLKCFLIQSSALMIEFETRNAIFFFCFYKTRHSDKLWQTHPLNLHRQEQHLLHWRPLQGLLHRKQTKKAIHFKLVRFIRFSPKNAPTNISKTNYLYIKFTETTDHLSLGKIFHGMCWFNHLMPASH